MMIRALLHFPIVDNPTSMITRYHRFVWFKSSRH